MAIGIGAPSFVAETTRTTGIGSYVPDRRIPRSARIRDIYAPGDTFDYFVDDNGGVAEFALGLLNADGSIARVSIHWTSLGGVGAAPVSWRPGKKTIRVYVAGGGTNTGGGQQTFPLVSGFWSGTVGASQKIERYIFSQSATLLAGMPGSAAIADIPNESVSGNFFVDELGGSLIDELGNLFIDGLTAPIGTTVGSFYVDELGNSIVDDAGSFFIDGVSGGGGGFGGLAVFDVRKNSESIGAMTFGLAQTNAVFSSISSTAFAAGDLFELVGPVSSGAIADLVWTIPFTLYQTIGTGGSGSPGPQGPAGPPGPTGATGPSGSGASVNTQDLDTSAGPQTYTLPAAQDDGEQWRVKDATGHAATNPITVTAGGVILIDGTPTTLINQNYASRTFRWKATMGKWLIE